MPKYKIAIMQASPFAYHTQPLVTHHQVHKIEKWKWGKISKICIYLLAKHLPLPKGVI